MFMSTGEKIPETAIRSQLAKILVTAAFRNSSVLSGFLQYAVDEKLAGRGRELKEYTIGINALLRSPDFNPQLDPVVRIHAGRLRRALKEYYYEQGKSDPLIIEIPKGGYIPSFVLKDSVSETETRQKTGFKKNKPVVAVLPFRNISQDASRDFFADGLGEYLSTELSRFHDLSVISYHSSRYAGNKTDDVRVAAELLGTKYILTGSIQHDTEHLRVWVQLILCDNGEQLWARSFEKSNSASGLFEIQNEIIRSILTAIGGYYGAIFRDAIKVPLSGPANGIEKYDAIFWYYYFQKVYTREVLQKTIEALESAVAEDPDYALAWAMLAELYIDDKALDIKKIENPIELALSCAVKAVNLDPDCQHAYQSLAWINLFLKNKRELIRAVEQCLKINPHSADKTGAMGFVLACAGEFDRGYELLSESFQQNPFSPWWFKIGYIFCFMDKGDYHQAQYWAEKINVPEIIWDPLIKASVYGHAGNFRESDHYRNLLFQIVPDGHKQIEQLLNTVLLSPDLIKNILEGLYRAQYKGVVGYR